MLDVVVVQEIYRWCRDRSSRCCGVTGKLQMVQGQECLMPWCCWESTNGAETGMLVVEVVQEIYRWCRDRNSRCRGGAGNPQMVQGQEF